MKSQFEVFKKGLSVFSRKYQKEIAKNPVLRAHFTKMCTKIGVDPLICKNKMFFSTTLIISIYCCSSASKGFWTEMLGIGDFYYELAVQIVEICFSMREETGGLIEMILLLKKLRVLRQKTSSEITEEDVERAIRTLEPFGSGYKIIKINQRSFVQSVPREFSQDQSVIMKKAAEKRGIIRFDDFKNEWNEERFGRTIESLIGEGLIWIDLKSNQFYPDYYFISFNDYSMI